MRQNRNVFRRAPVRRRWLALLAVLPMFAGMTAFGLAPDTVVQDVPTETVVQDVALPPVAAASTDSFDFWREERIQRGDTLASLLGRLGVSDSETALFLQQSHGNPALARLAAGRSVLARVTSSGRLLLFRYLTTDDRLLTVNRSGGDFMVQDQAVQLESRPMMRAGRINNSLFGATDAADIPDAVATQMAEIFSGDIDFHRDLRRGDHFSVVYEAYYHEGALVRTGRLLAAEFVNGGQSHRAVFFRDGQGREGYFAPDGRSLKRAFLKSPMPFTRISSGFSTARYHPVLKEWRAHKGIDYAAPTGTPIRAVADATVGFVGRQGGYGNLLILNHQRPYSTAYGHLSRFAPGMRKGAHIQQGQIVGYVGATGLATGPHLHYEFRVAGVQKNPLALKLPTAFPLEGRARAQFASLAQPLVARLDLMAGSTQSAID